MTEEKVKVIVGSLLHDVGKILYRSGDGRNHSASGYEFLKEIPGFSDKKILNCVRYHHSGSIREKAEKDPEGLFYLTYLADNIAAFMDRRENESGERGFVRDIPLESIFNILNGNREKKVYGPSLLQADEPMAIPKPETEARAYDDRFYEKIIGNIRDALRGLSLTGAYVNSLLEVLEANLSFIPSSTNRGELADISLYDHCKITAALACCLMDYAGEHHIQDYREKFFLKARDFYEEKAFLLYSMDISGIQNFIYSISSKGALKGLRARSFYLEMVLQHAIDELLEALELSRANVLYIGGGHGYMLLPNTVDTRLAVGMFEREVNRWFMDNMGADLYMAGGMAECSAHMLKNKPEGSYADIFRRVSAGISQRKLHRYDAEQIRRLNRMRPVSHDRECVICKRTDLLDEQQKCRVCAGLEKLSSGILRDEFISILDAVDGDAAMPLPYERYLAMDSGESLRKRMEKNDHYLRSYSKNRQYTGYQMVSKLWIGDYAKESEFQKLAAHSQGVSRIAVLRADVDNLGKAFVHGFSAEKSTISRTATFSRKLSAFFKLHINAVLREGRYHLDGSREVKERQALIVYSGGDDMFVVGAWNDMIGFAVDLYERFKEFTQEALTFSAGIGIYQPTYPISAMARECGELEELSKDAPGKNSCTLFSEGHTYSWNVLIKCVLGEKFVELRNYFSSQEDKGMGLLYRMVQLIRDKERENRLNIARFAYLLARLEPDPKRADAKETERYRHFARQMYRWIQDKEDSRQLITAIYLYVYLNRGNMEDEKIR